MRVLCTQKTRLQLGACQVPPIRVQLDDSVQRAVSEPSGASKFCASTAVVSTEVARHRQAPWRALGSENDVVNPGPAQNKRSGRGGVERPKGLPAPAALPPAAAKLPAAQRVVPGRRGRALAQAARLSAPTAQQPPSAAVQAQRHAGPQRSRAGCNAAPPPGGRCGAKKRALSPRAQYPPGNPSTSRTIGLCPATLPAAEPLAELPQKVTAAAEAMPAASGRAACSSGGGGAASQGHASEIDELCDDNLQRIFLMLPVDERCVSTVRSSYFWPLYRILTESTRSSSEPGSCLCTAHSMHAVVDWWHEIVRVRLDVNSSQLTQQFSGVAWTGLCRCNSSARAQRVTVGSRLPRRCFARRAAERPNRAAAGGRRSRWCAPGGAPCLRRRTCGPQYACAPPPTCAATDSHCPGPPHAAGCSSAVMRCRSRYRGRPPRFSFLLIAHPELQVK